MSPVLTFPMVLLVVTVLAVVGFFLGRRRALAADKAAAGVMHSRPNQHG